MRSCGGSSVMSSPKKWIRPAVGGKSPVMALKSVVLPAPLEPRIAAFSPAATENDTSSTARSAPKARVTPASTSASPDSRPLPDDAPGWRRGPLSRADHDPPWRAGGRSDVIDAIGDRLYLRQSGTSREPRPIFLNSASGRPSVCEMFGTVLTTLL